MAATWISWIYETTSRIFAAQKPWGSHGRKRIYFDEWKFQMQSKEWRQSQHGIWEKSGARRRLSWKCWNSCWMGCDFPIPHGRIDVMFGPAVTTEAQLAFSGARIHSNNTAEMTAMIELLSFLGPRGPVTRDEQSCSYYDSMHAAGICLGSIQARTHVQLALARQQSLIRAQRRLRLTMQHVYGHSGKLGNERADHAAALGTFGLISNHNVAIRWIHHNFDASVCFNGCDNISEVLEWLQHFRTNVTSFHQDRG